MGILEALVVLLSVALLVSGLVVAVVILITSQPLADIVVLKGEESFYDPNTGK